ncbi:ABC transporter permease [Pollutimonas subterranea]|uniref:ABC transporter permease n=1 Tax=Pollutimonas subterranea TaxID=2045210 RepID=A0A2N4U6I6_9BURK|nr:amino acid ABC transporter permease [Pollutimonas subterranea]PLC50613.1 ABC transporter permease [Pollutimonas subterranea]
MTLIERLAGYVPAIVSGTLTTAWLSAVAIAVGFIAAIALYVFRTQGGSLGRTLVHGYVSFFRGTPLLVQLLMLFYLPSALGVDLQPEIAAIAALGLNSAAFQSEILRAGFSSIPYAQLETASAFGLSQRQILWNIQIPQVLRLTQPSLVSESIDIIKGSAVLSVIAIADLMRVGRQLTAVSYRPLEVYVSVALAYLVLTSLLVLLAGYLANRNQMERAA